MVRRPYCVEHKEFHVHISPEVTDKAQCGFRYVLMSCGLCGCVSQVVVVAARKHSNYTPTDDQHATSTPLAEQVNFAYKRADDAPNETQRATSTPNPEHVNFGSKSADYAPRDNRRATSRPKPEHLNFIYKTGLEGKGES